VSEVHDVLGLKSVMWR